MVGGVEGEFVAESGHLTLFGGNRYCSVDSLKLVRWEKVLGGKEVDRGNILCRGEE